MNWEIKLVRVGRIVSNSRGSLLGAEPGNPVVMPMWMCAITDGAHKVIIDTGIADDLHEIVDGPEPNCRQNECEKTCMALKNAVGWEPEDVDIVINTHLHFDHCGGNRFFKNARFYIQKKELEAAQHPTGDFAFLYYEKYISSILEQRKQLILLQEDRELLPGLTLIQTPGHSVGHQSVLIQTDTGTVCFAADAVPMFENIKNNIATSINVSPLQCTESYKKIKSMANAVIPGHDYRMLDLEINGFSLE